MESVLDRGAVLVTVSRCCSVGLKHCGLAVSADRPSGTQDVPLTASVEKVQNKAPTWIPTEDGDDLRLRLRASVCAHASYWGREYLF